MGGVINPVEDAQTLDSFDSTAFAILAGRSGGQILAGGTADNDDLTLRAGTSAVRGDLIFQTGSTGEVARLRGSDGKFGINTNDPQSRLHVSLGSGTIPSINGNTVLLLSQADSSASMSFITSPTGSTRINFGDTTSETGIGALIYTRASTDDFRFMVNSGEVARFVAASFGLSTTDPKARLHANVGTGSVPAIAGSTIGIFQSNTTAGDDVGISLIAGTTGSCLLNMGDSGDENIGGMGYDNNVNALSFTTNTAVQLTIDSDGRIGHKTAAVATSTFISTRTHTATSGTEVGHNITLEANPGASSSAITTGISGIAQTQSANSQSFFVAFNGIIGKAIHNGTGTFLAGTGGVFTFAKNSTGAVTVGTGISVRVENNDAAGAIAVATGILIDSPIATGTIDDFIGLRIEDPSGLATTTRAIHVKGGLVDLQDDNTGVTNLLVQKNVSTATVPVARILQDATDGVVPCLELQQDDVSQDVIDFIASDRGVITGNTATIASVRVALNGVIYRLGLFVDA